MFSIDSGRVLRAIVTGLILLGVLWALHLLSAHKASDAAVAHAHTSASSGIAPAPPPEATQIVPFEVTALPFAAMDNGCLDGVETDLSRCTGFLSGGRARDYLLHLHTGQSLQIRVEPLYDAYDPAFALLHDNKCITAQDVAGMGRSEYASVANLDSGDYQLWVGGYDGDCGPFLLSIDNAPPSLASIPEATLYSGRNGNILRWKSFGEVDIDNFQLYRINGERREHIATLRAHGSPASFASYRFYDRVPRGGSGYELEMVTRDGRSEVREIAS